MGSCEQARFQHFMELDPICTKQKFWIRPRQPCWSKQLKRRVCTSSMSKTQRQKTHGFTTPTCLTGNCKFRSWVGPDVPTLPRRGSGSTPRCQMKPKLCCHNWTHVYRQTDRQTDTHTHTHTHTLICTGVTSNFILSCGLFFSKIVTCFRNWPFPNKNTWQCRHNALVRKSRESVPAEVGEQNGAKASWTGNPNDQPEWPTYIWWKGERDYGEGNGVLQAKQATHTSNPNV